MFTAYGNNLAGNVMVGLKSHNPNADVRKNGGARGWLGNTGIDCWQRYL